MAMEDKGEVSETINGEAEYEKLKKAFSAFFSIVLLSVGIVLGFSSGPLGAGVTIVISMIIYILLFTFGAEIRMPFLMLALGTHIGFLYKYWEHITILPLFYITKDKLGGSLAFDYVQLLVYLEIFFDIRSLLKKRNEKTNNIINKNYIAIAKENDNKKDQ